MTREEMISKLCAINVCVVNITYTYDVGLFFDILSSKGVSSTEGYNIGQWPCFKLCISDSEGIKQLVSRLRNGDVVTDGELLDNTAIRELCTYHSYTSSWLVDGETLANCIGQIRNGLKDINYVQDSLFVYVSLEAKNVCVAFFKTYFELQDFFCQKWNVDCRSWVEMCDEELNKWYHVAEENDLGGVPYMEIKTTDYDY